MDRFSKQLLPFVSLIFIIVLWSILEPSTFLTSRNLMNVLSRSSINGIMAAGMTFVIITGGIDLSVGSMLAICGMLGSIAMLALSGADWVLMASGNYVPLGLSAMVIGTLASMLAGGLFGLTNGLLITRLKLAPFIVTLGTMSMFRGAAYVLNDGKPFSVSDYSWLDMGTILGVPSSIFITALVFLVMGFILKVTPFGRYTYAIGSNQNTAFHAGVNVRGVLVAIYTLVGVLVGLAAMIAISRASSAQPTAGIALELDIIAAVIIGGCSPSGGRGTMTGTLIGTLLVQFLRNGLTLLGISTNMQLVAVGAIIILAVSTDQVANNRKATA